MKIKIYIVTYNNKVDINNNLNTLFNSNFNNNNVEVNIINNHSTFNIDSKYKSKVNILHNTLRPDFSNGHLSRNWNQAIINGFKDLNNPDCDILIHCQDDLLWSKDWLSYLIKTHEKYSFFTGQVGDTFCSYTPEAVKNIGLWDERFCHIQYQEFDYFLRALLHNKDKTSINSYVYLPKTQDKITDLLLNPIPISDLDNYFPRRPDRNEFRENQHIKSGKWVNHAKLLFSKKWGIPHPRPVFLKGANIGKPTIKNYIFYPYFEKDIYNLKEKNYLVQ